MPLTTPCGDSTGVGLAADGNDDGVIDGEDYTIWVDNFGEVGGGAAWSEAGLLSSLLVGKSYVTGSSLFDDGMSISLSELWNETSLANPTTDLVFQYHVVGESGLRTGVIDVVAGSLLSGTQVPEPSSIILLSIPVIGCLLVGRRQGLTLMFGLVFFVVATCSNDCFAQIKNDRVYLFGEGTDDGGGNNIYVVDSAFSATYDEAVDGRDLTGTAHDLIA